MSSWRFFLRLVLRWDSVPSVVWGAMSSTITNGDQVVKRVALKASSLADMRGQHDYSTSLEFRVTELVPLGVSRPPPLAF